MTERAPVDREDHSTNAILQAALRLETAARSRTPCSPIRDLIDPDDVQAAYAVQQQLAAGRLASGAVVVGRKIGLTSEAVQRQLGVDRPDFGVLFADMRYRHDESIPMNRLLQPKIEAEIAFVLAEDLADGPLDAERVRGAVAHAVPALEVVDSRIAGWDISFADTVADNASSGLFVLGDVAAPLSVFEPAEAEMTMTIADRTVSAGSGAACLGDPLNALQWLAGTARDLGDPLRAGQVVLSGALGPMVVVEAGAVVTANITGLGTVTARFGAA
ncbi:MAG: 2-keto-4-pentenoate hydratase [Kribbellaceae bacterium]|nr:2-keto-4-pentenoate hydratase [Kribbellaceae bacterium]